MIYGGTIKPGSCEGAPQLDIVSAFQSYGKYLEDGKTDAAEKFRYNTVRHACPGPGACGGVSANPRFAPDEAETFATDVYGEYHGQRRGGHGYDAHRLLFVPCGVPREDRRV